MATNTYTYRPVNQGTGATTRTYAVAVHGVQAATVTGTRHTGWVATATNTGAQTPLRYPTRHQAVRAALAMPTPTLPHPGTHTATVPGLGTVKVHVQGSAALVVAQGNTVHTGPMPATVTSMPTMWAWVATLAPAPKATPHTTLPCPHTGRGPCGACGLCRACNTTGPYAMCLRCGVYGACGNCANHRCPTSAPKGNAAPLAAKAPRKHTVTAPVAPQAPTGHVQGVVCPGTGTCWCNTPTAPQATVPVLPPPVAQQQQPTPTAPQAATPPQRPSKGRVALLALVYLALAALAAVAGFTWVASRTYLAVNRAANTAARYLRGYLATQQQRP